MNNLCIKRNVIDISYSQKIIDYLKNNSPSKDPTGYSPFGVYSGISSNETFQDIFKIIYSNCKNLIQDNFNCQVYDEGISDITEMSTGHFLPVHYDHNPALNKNVLTKTGAGHPERNISSVFYYNDDFQGGELYFPNQNILIEPEPGLFVSFPANDDFPHEVKVIKNGRRWCSTSFWCIKKD